MTLLRRLFGVIVPDRTVLWGIPGLYPVYVFSLVNLGLVAGAITRRPMVAGAAMAVAAVVEAGVALPAARGNGSLSIWRNRARTRSRIRALLFVIALAAGGVAHELIVAFAVAALVVDATIAVLRSDRLDLGTTTKLRPLGSMRAGVDNLARARRTARLRDVAELPLEMSLGFAGLALSLPSEDVLGSASAIAGAAALVGLTVVFAAGIAVACRRLRPQMLLRHDDEVRKEFLAFDPEVVCYFNGHRGSTYAVDVWLRTFEALGRRVALIYRHNDVWDVDTDDLPAIVARKDAMIEQLIGPSTKVALYPANGTLNVHLQRDTRLSHVFIGHGDSDKAGSASPFTRSYDEVWVSGRAGIDRYRASGIDIPEDRFAIVGRPPLSPKVRAIEAKRAAERYEARGEQPPVRALLDELDRVDNGTRPTTVLYAPTWEGYFAASDYSSVGPMGREIVETLLEAMPDARIVFKPHPLTGHRLPELEDTIADIQKLLARQPGHHPSADDHPDVGLYDWFDLADLLVCDVSSVLSDFMAWDRPYIVTNPKCLATHEFHARFPSTIAAYIMDAGAAANRMVVESAITHDPLRDKRPSVREYFLGPADRDALDIFEEAVDRLYEKTAARG